jgi:hypothetical protein
MLLHVCVPALLDLRIANPPVSNSLGPFMAAVEGVFGRPIFSRLRARSCCFSRFTEWETEENKSALQGPTSFVFIMAMMDLLPLNH